ncbi:hypothetical protein MUO14_17135 [Halobacillus shinanisalinarum]|uniref:SR1 protein n=1 Tax=Halobacillus shinanisalinarum TaxID=2932258 RepID=A0ABY4GZK7_9BACI|nr:hypothetical protein [Halobacillus shinanisalinarum]UOQ92197.1 hypothetical protein MUO14_17135 [Halobacillus shinanisalinarum]
MRQYQAGELIEKRCRKCFHDEAKVMKVERREFEEKMVLFLLCQCPECGMNDDELIPEDESVNK